MCQHRKLKKKLIKEPEIIETLDNVFGSEKLQTKNGESESIKNVALYSPEQNNNEKPYQDIKQDTGANFNVADYNQTQNLNVRQIWGKVVSSLRTSGERTLYIACGEIRDLELKDNKLVVFVKEDHLYNVLKRPENIQKIVLILNQNNVKIDFEVVLKEKEQDKVEQTLVRLKDLFGDFLEIK